MPSFHTQAGLPSSCVAYYARRFAFMLALAALLGGCTVYDAPYRRTHSYGGYIGFADAYRGPVYRSHRHYVAPPVRRRAPVVRPRPHPKRFHHAVRPHRGPHRAAVPRQVAPRIPGAHMRGRHRR